MPKYIPTRIRENKNVNDNEQLLNFFKSYLRVLEVIQSRCLCDDCPVKIELKTIGQLIDESYELIKEIKKNSNNNNIKILNSKINTIKELCNKHGMQSVIQSIN